MGIRCTQGDLIKNIPILLPSDKMKTKKALYSIYEFFGLSHGRNGPRQVVKNNCLAKSGKLQILGVNPDFCFVENFSYGT